MSSTLAHRVRRVNVAASPDHSRGRVMFRTNDPFWSRQAAREGLMGQDQRVSGSQIGLFMKQRQTDFMNSPG